MAIVDKVASILDGSWAGREAAEWLGSQIDCLWHGTGYEGKVIDRRSPGWVREDWVRVPDPVGSEPAVCVTPDITMACSI